MSAAIYKPGQGYWTRAMSAVFFGILILAAAAWAWGQAAAVKLPTASYGISVSQVEGEITVGKSVDLIRIDLDDEPVVIGSAAVLASERGLVTIGPATLTGTEYGASELDSLRVGSAEEPTYSAKKEAVRIDPVFPITYLQAGLASTIVLIGAIALFIYVGSHRKSVDFLINTDGEMKKVNWSTKREIIGSTQVVIVAAFLIAALLFGIDKMFSEFFRLVDVLQV